MGKTFDQSLIDTANIPMSMIDPEDMQDKTSEEFISMRRVQSGCHSELTNREDFPFSKFNKTLSLSKNQDTYSMIDGSIKNIYIGTDKLTYLTDFSGLNSASGKPRYYTVTSNPEKIKVFPKPEASYTANIEYLSTKNVILPNSTYSYTIENDSTLRMPERVQHLYFDALEYYVLATNMRKQSNPRWQPTLEIFREKWRAFLNGCRQTDNETIFTI